MIFFHFIFALILTVPFLFEVHFRFQVAKIDAELDDIREEIKKIQELTP